MNAQIRNLAAAARTCDTQLDPVSGTRLGEANRQCAGSFEQYPIGLCVLEQASPIADRYRQGRPVVAIEGLGDR